MIAGVSKAFHMIWLNVFRNVIFHSFFSKNFAIMGFMCATQNQILTYLHHGPNLGVKSRQIIWKKASEMLVAPRISE